MNINKKAFRLIIFLSIVFMFVSGCILIKFNKDFLLLWNVNNIVVSVDKPLEKDKVKIEFGVSVNTINRSNDSDLFAEREKYTILFENGIRKDEMINDYGENDFLITYDGKYYLSFRQFKFNRRHQHTYKFHFHKKEDKVYVKVDIDGKDAMKFETAMIDITLSEQYRCNVPIESAGTIYNMVEMIGQ